ncbi:MAG TPA: hypothetical protein VJ785_08500 [Anaerolineales bacterium]|nr:hypothetical protein [Anaerolineales bacterium]
MKLNYAGTSVVLFIISIAMLILLTLFESSLSWLPTDVERIVSGLLLVLPAVLGVFFGVLSLLRKESRRWLAMLGIVLNGLSALFHISVLSFAG